MNLHMFSLLRLDEDQQNATNLPNTSIREQISVYINNAVVLSRTLALRGIEFTLLTNNRSLIESIVLDHEHGSALNILDIPFITEVPSGVRFYSAHYKLDAFRHQCLRTIFRIQPSFFSHVPNAEVLDKSGLPLPSEILRQRQVALCQFIADMPDGSFMKVLVCASSGEPITWNSQRCRGQPRGRPRQMWTSEVYRMVLNLNNE